MTFLCKKLFFKTFSDVFLALVLTCQITVSLFVGISVDFFAIRKNAGRWISHLFSICVLLLELDANDAQYCRLYSINRWVVSYSLPTISSQAVENEKANGLFEIF